MSDVVNLTPDDLSPISRDELIRVEQALQLRLGYRVRDLHLYIEPHGLVLTGHASSYYDKQLAQRVVTELGNLIVAENRITVDLPSPDSPIDPSGKPEGYRSHRRQLDPPHATQSHECAASHAYFFAR